MSGPGKQLEVRRVHLAGVSLAAALLSHGLSQGVAAEKEGRGVGSSTVACGILHKSSLLWLVSFPI